MSYLSIATCVQDHQFAQRINACWSQEGGDTSAIPAEVYWTVAGASDVEAAYESALASDNPSPGGDPTVITDQMILSHVQPLIPIVTQGEPR